MERLSRFAVPVLLACAAVAILFSVVPAWTDQQQVVRGLRTDLFAVKSSLSAADQVTDLPEDGNMYHWVTFLRDKNNLTDPADRNLLALYAYPQTAAVKSQCHENVYDGNSQMWKERFADKLGATPPLFALIAYHPTDATQNGKVVFKRSGTGIPQDPKIFYADLRTAIKRVAAFPPHPKPTPPPGPSPCPTPFPQPGPPVIPDTPGPDDEVEPDEEGGGGVGLGIVAVAALIGALLGAARAARKEGEE